MKQGLLSWLSMGAATLLVTSQAWAFDGDHREMDWHDKLSLTTAQQDQIDDIEDKYRDQMRKLRRAERKSGNKNEQKSADKKDEFDALFKAMRADMRDVLTDEQRDKARAMMSEQRSKMLIRQARQLALDLDMSIEQEQKLLKKVAKLKGDFDWPMDKDQRDATRKQFDDVLKSVLTDEQIKQLDERKERQRNKFHRPGDAGFGGTEMPRPMMMPPHSGFGPGEHGFGGPMGGPGMMNGPMDDDDR